MPEWRARVVASDADIRQRVTAFKAALEAMVLEKVERMESERSAES